MAPTPKKYAETETLLADIKNIHTNRTREYALLSINEPSLEAANKFRVDLVESFKIVNQELQARNKPEKPSARKVITSAFKKKEVRTDDGEKIQEAAAYMNRELTNLIQAAKDNNGKFRIPEATYNKKLAEILNKGMGMMPQTNVKNPVFDSVLQKMKNDIQNLKAPKDKQREHPKK